MFALGSYIKACREKLHAQYGDYSIRSVAKRIGIHHSYLSKLERGEHAPLTETTLTALARELGENADILCALGGKLTQRITHLIKTNLDRFSQFINDIEGSGEADQGRGGAKSDLERRNSELEELVRRLKFEVREMINGERNAAQDESYWKRLINSTDGFCVGLLDAGFTLLWANDAIQRIIGPGKTQVTGRCHEILKQSPQPCSDCSAQKCLATGVIQTEIFLSCLPGVGKQWVTNVPLRNRQGHVHQVLRFGFSPTERESGHDFLAKAEELVQYAATLETKWDKYRSIIESCSDAFYRINADGRIAMINIAGARLLGYGSPEELVGIPAETLWLNPLLRSGMLTELHVHNELWDYPTVLKSKDGSPRYVSVSAHLLRNEEGAVQGIEGTLRDISERKQMEEQLLYRALHDPLTGLANRTLCLDGILQAERRAALKPGGNFAVVFLDIHRFKFINDSLGHQAGDALLCQVAKRLLACVRPVDMVSRYGGDVFTLVLEDLSPRETVRTLLKIRDKLKAPMTIESYTVSLQACYGIAYPSSGRRRGPEVLLRNADIAMHKAKAAGRDRIVVYRTAMHEAASKNLSVQSDMRRGLAAGEFFMVYQPIFRLDTSCLTGFEALIRWNHPQRGLVSPKDFIPQAEDSGFILELGQFSLERACQDMAQLLPMLNPQGNLTVSVNLSPRQFSRQGLAKRIRQKLTDTGLPPSRLVLEITESSLLEHPEAAGHTLAKLKKMGIGIALDDFGIGYSSISVLQTLPLDRLKVDMSFVGKMTGNRQGCDIVRAIILLGKSLSLKLVAEGIQSELELSALQSMGCDLGQGYLYSRPLLLADVPLAIREKSCA